MNSVCLSIDESNATPAQVRLEQRLDNARLRRERTTLSAVIECFCRAHHSPQGALCPECQGLLDYATVRLARCRFGQDKPTCAKCPVHCYQSVRREQVKRVMRYAGPRMLWQHPFLALGHWWDARRSLKSRTAQGL